MKTPNQASQRDMRILIAIDLSDATETIVNKAETFAKALSPGMAGSRSWSKVNPLASLHLMPRRRKSEIVQQKDFETSIARFRKLRRGCGTKGL